MTYGATTTFTAGNGTSVASVAKPSGTALDHILIAQLYIENAGEAPTISSTGETWTLVHSITNPTPTPDMHLYVWIALVANVSSTIGVTWGGSSFWRDFSVHRFFDIDTVTPQDVTATENQGTGTTITGLGLASGTAGRDLVLCAATFSGRVLSSISSPLTARENTSGQNTAMASGIDTAGNDTANKTATITSDDWAAIMLALRPASVPAKAPPPQRTRPLRMWGRPQW